MPNNNIEQIRSSLSPERFNAYRLSPNDKDLDILARYLWNIAMSESLYPTLQSLEISFRNSIHDAISDLHTNQSWFDIQPSFLDQQQQNSIQGARDSLSKQKKPHDPGRIVAELTFGFWTSLLDRRYDQILWPALLKPAFPHMPRHIRTRKVLSKRVNDIRLLRNRIFHHEPIWNFRALLQRHSDMLEAIAWMNPALLDLIKLFDRFPEVHSGGLKPYRDKLETLLSGDS